MKKYEYLIQWFPLEDEPWKITETCDALSALGDKGWELVALLPIETETIKMSLCYFKREKSN